MISEMFKDPLYIAGYNSVVGKICPLSVNLKTAIYNAM